MQVDQFVRQQRNKDAFYGTSKVNARCFTSSEKNVDA